MELFKTPKSKFYWFDFKIAGKRYRGSTKETNRTRAEAIAALKMSQVIEGNDPLPKKPTSLTEFSGRFLEWIKTSALEQKTKTYYQTGWRLLKMTDIPGMRLDQITADMVEATRFPGSPSNANCAFRTCGACFTKPKNGNCCKKFPSSSW